MNLKILISLALFSHILFAGSGGGGGGGLLSPKPTGVKYKCFNDIGYHKNDKKHSNLFAHSSYCLPSTNFDNCTNEWQWSLSNTNNTITQTNLNCNFACQGAQQGQSNPIDTYVYCINEQQWSNVAKCVDKSSGKELIDSQCSASSTNPNAYWKPKCAENDTLDKCIVRLQAYDWRLCHNSTSYNTLDYNGGKNSVIFSEFQIQGNRYPCNQTSKSPAGGATVEEVEPPITAIGNLIIMDEKDSDRDDSLVHTKISNESYAFRIKVKNTDGSIYTGNLDGSCTINGGGTSNRSAIRSSNSSSGFFAKIASLLTGKSGYRFPDNGNYSPTQSGTYTITCEAKDSSGNAVSGAIDFFVAPHSYKYTSISASFINTTSSLGGLNNDIKTIELLDKAYTLQYSNKQDNTQKVDVSQIIKSWNTKPVVKIGNTIDIKLAQVSAVTKGDSVDIGVDSKNKLGSFSPDLKEITITTLGITNGDNPESANAAGGTCKSTAESGNTPQIAAVAMSNGISDANSTLIKIDGTEAQVAKADIVLYDRALYDKINSEEGNGKCSGFTFPCPYPTRLVLTNFPYEIAPFNFQVELLDTTGNPLKVLYWGQGTSPKVEAGSSLKISALRATNSVAKTFTSGCAAQNMQFITSIDGTSGGSYYIEFVDRDGKSLTLKASDFKDGVASIDDAIIKVQKDKDTPFTPAMKSEPYIIKAPVQFPAQMQYAFYPPDTTYYPKYENIIIGSTNDMVILRARINSIDTDNSSGSSINSSITPTKVWYEFQCEYCNISNVYNITGYTNYSNNDKSPTQQGWWIDRRFSANNNNKITASKAEIESNNGTISSVSASIDSGLQTISYGNLSQGTHKLNIKHGNESNDNTFNGATTMPYFLLYNTYWTGTSATDTNGNQTSTLISPIKWNTSSFIYVKGNAPDDKRDYGLDTDGAKNTRSGGRTGKY